MKLRLRHADKGFTILELLIAVTIFSVMLLIVGGVIMQLTKQFYKGLVMSKTQEVARSISEEITTNLQFSGSDPYYIGSNGAVRGWCIADRRYMFVLSRQLGNTPPQSRGVLMRGGACTDPLPANLSPGTGLVELIGDRMRLADLDINHDGPRKVWSVKLRVVYGDDDLLCSPARNDCAAITTSTNLGEEDLSCKPQAGSQFCAAVEYAATVAKRL